jgi:hypothetical protein
MQGGEAEYESQEGGEEEEEGEGEEWGAAGEEGGEDGEEEAAPAPPQRPQRKKLQPFEVPTSGAFWLHDDRFEDTGADEEGGGLRSER